MTLRFLTPLWPRWPWPALRSFKRAKDRSWGSDQRAAPRSALEARFTAALSASDQDQWLKTLSAEPHHAWAPPPASEMWNG